MIEIEEAIFRAIRRYAETHPRPPHVTQAQAARMLNVSAVTVGKWVRQGRLKLNGFGLIPIEQIDARLAASEGPGASRMPSRG